MAKIPHKFELMSDLEIANGVGGTLIIDTELYPNYFLIAMKDIVTKKIIKFEINRNTGECLNERKLSYILHSYTTVGFNIIKYDFPIIWLAFKIQSNNSLNIDETLNTLRKVSDEIILQNIWPGVLEADYDFKIFRTNFVDLIEICPGKGSLKLYAGRLHTQRIQDLPFPVDKELSNDEIDVVADYCINDLNSTEDILYHNIERLKLRYWLSQEYNTNMLSKSDAQMAEAIISKEIYKLSGKKVSKTIIETGTKYRYNAPHYLSYKTPQLKKLLDDVCDADFIINNVGKIDTPKIFDNYFVQLNDFKYKFGIGGLHSCENTISYKSDDTHIIIDRDVASYYPRIITNLELYPQHLGEVFLRAYTTIIVNRLEAKKTKQFTRDKGLKIAINGTSGKFNNEYSIVYSPNCYIQMTLTGQLTILLLVEMLETNDFKVISANTDGIVIYCKRDKYEELNQIVKYWEKLTNFETEETQYKAYYARDVNAYFAVKLDDSVKVKGPYSEVGSQSGTILDNNPITLICSDAVKLLLSKNIPIDETINNCKDIRRFVTIRNVKGGAHKDGYYLGKVVRWYYAKNIIGTINYVLTNNKVPDTDGAKPCMDLPSELPNDIDYDYYISKAVDILFEIGYYKKVTQERLF